MKLFLQIEIGNWQHAGHAKVLVNYASSLSRDILGIDLDCQSEPMISDMVIRMIDQAHKVFVLVQVNDSNLPLSGTSKVFHCLSSTSDKVAHAVICGDHRTAENLLTVFASRVVKESDPEKIKELIYKFSQL